MTPKAIVTDVEGTTSSIAFVHEVLFPYARARLARFVADNVAQLGQELSLVREAAGEPELDTAGSVEQLLAWHDADRKIAPLKTLQGLIWAQGYSDGTLVGHVYPDAVTGLVRWHASGMPLYVYSSGSVAAQKLLFGHTAVGDLTALFAGHFDTTVGGKRDSESYREIARRIALEPAEILFLSDIAEELAAARAAGLNVMMLARDNLPTDTDFPIATSFDTILAEGLPA